MKMQLFLLVMCIGFVTASAEARPVLNATDKMLVDGDVMEYGNVKSRKTKAVCDGIGKDMKK